jgi:DICT domain-containing protein
VVDQPACVVGWERPGQERRADPKRIFETIWSLDPTVVRRASRVALSIAARHIPELQDIDDILTESAAVPAKIDARHVSELLGRTLEYLTKAA